MLCRAMFRHVLAICIAATSAPAQQRTDTSVTKAALIAADRELAAATDQEGAEAFLRAVTPDAAVLFPGQQIFKGAAEAHDAFIARYESPSAYWWTPVHAVASADGSFGCTFGYSRFHDAADTVTSEHRGVYLSCWKKAPDGKWRIAGTQRSDSPSPPPEMTDSISLRGAPHSAVAAEGGNGLADAQDADSLFAMLAFERAGPGPAFMKYSASDAMLVGGPEFPRGPQQIADAFRDYSPDRVITWRPRRDLGAAAGGLAFTVGNSLSGPRAGKVGPANPGKYFTIWRQEPDGRWLYILDLGSPRPASAK